MKRFKHLNQRIRALTDRQQLINVVNNQAMKYKPQPLPMRLDLSRL